MPHQLIEGILQDWTGAMGRLIIPSFDCVCVCVCGAAELKFGLRGDLRIMNGFLNTLKKYDFQEQT